ncbi:hypothetical protein ACWEP4_21820 [Streptomyces sp. NPDC004227]
MSPAHRRLDARGVRYVATRRKAVQWGAQPITPLAFGCELMHN